MFLRAISGLLVMTGVMIRITPACLPENAEKNQNYDGEIVKLVAWGAHDNAFPSDVPKEANLLPWNWNECRDQYNDDLHISMTCASSLTASPCNGDSGSGLMWQEPDGNERWTVVGVASFIYECAQPGKPYKFADVTHVVTWITKMIGCEGAESDRPHYPPPRKVPCDDESNVGHRIVGGVETGPYEFLSHVGLEYDGWYGPYCGAVIISDTYVLTIVHCVRGVPPEKLKVLIGYHNLTSLEPFAFRYPVRRIHTHEDFNPFTFENDIALITLAEPLNFHLKNFVAPACLPESDETYEGENAVTVGWGVDFVTYGNDTYTIRHDTLQKVEVVIISNEDCGVLYNQSMPAAFLCAGTEEGGKDACWGDGGGPIFVELDGHFHLVGLVSWGRGCGLKEFPGVYARVSNYNDWILKNTYDLQTNY